MLDRQSVAPHDSGPQGFLPRLAVYAPVQHQITPAFALPRHSQ